MIYKVLQVNSLKPLEGKPISKLLDEVAGKLPQLTFDRDLRRTAIYKESVNIVKTWLLKNEEKLVEAIDDFYEARDGDHELVLAHRGCKFMGWIKKM